MATVINRTTLQILKSVNTPDYPDKDFIINPDLSKVMGVPAKYLEINENEVIEIDAEKKILVDTTLSNEASAKSPACPYGLRAKCEYLL